MAIYAFCTVAFVPGSVLTIGAGIAFTAATNNVALGIFVGTTTVFLGATLGATLAFFLGHYLLKDLTEKLRAKFTIVRAIDKAIEMLTDPIHGSKARGKKVVGITQIHVDDVFISGEKEFEQIVQKMYIVT